MRSKSMKKLGTLALATLLLVAAPLVTAKEEDLAARRASIDEMARQTLEKLFEMNSSASALADEAVGFAVFDSVKGAFIISGGGGVGVAVNSRTGERTYMKMGTAGIGFGLGGQSYQVIVLFETDKALERFIRSGWQADAKATAAAGASGTNAGSTFMNGIAVYQLTYKGLMANADVSGTKVWKHKKLNGEAVVDEGDDE
jgi:lipid-binding SYLF domain-containing protein